MTRIFYMQRTTCSFEKESNFFQNWSWNTLVCLLLTGIATVCLNKVVLSKSTHFGPPSRYCIIGRQCSELVKRWQVRYGWSALPLLGLGLHDISDLLRLPYYCLQITDEIVQISKNTLLEPDKARIKNCVMKISFFL